jgi:3-oxoadipate enol-lactonase
MKITANGITINYELEGPATAPVLTLSHSLATDLTMWDPQIPALSRRYRVLRYDTRGHGGTDAPAGRYSLEQLADDARALLAALGIAKTHWIGLSMGGMIGQTLALRAGEVLQSLALCDTSSRIPREAQPAWDDRIRTAERDGMEPLVDATLGRWFTPAFRERRRDAVTRVADMIRGTNPCGYAGCCHAIRALDLTHRLEAIALPTLIIVGEEDPGTPVAASEAIRNAIPASELVVLKSASHLSNIEQADEFTRTLLGFLDRVAR